MNSQLKQSSARGGFTLLELLAVLVVMGILSGMVLYAVRGAQQDAIEARTRGTIMKIHEVLASRWKDYLVNPVKLPISESALEASLPRDIARAQLNAIRDAMRLEFPDRPGDLFEPPAMISIGTSGETASIERPPANSAMIGRFDTVPANWTDWAINNKEAELLYMIVEVSSLNGSPAMEMFRQTEIGDTDGDGYFEFIDGWGRAISFIRWPAGFPTNKGPLSEMDPFLYDHFQSLASVGRATAGTADFRGADPIDINLADWGYDLVNGSGATAWRRDYGLFPLIISAGADGEYGINFDLNTTGLSAPTVNANWYSYSNIIWNYTNGPTLVPAYLTVPNPNIDPYHPRLSPIDSTRYLVGQILSTTTSEDNVTNFDEFGASL